MPFVSEAQRRKCYVIQKQMNEQGLVSNWNCKEFEKASPKKSPKTKKSPVKSAKKSPKKLKMKVNGEQVFKGVRGGKYVMRKNKKVYI